MFVLKEEKGADVLVDPHYAMFSTLTNITFISAKKLCLNLGCLVSLEKKNCVF